MDGLDESLAVLRESFKRGKTRTAAWRKSQLNGILKLVGENEEKIFQALNEDIGKHPVEAYRDEGYIPLIFFPAKARVVPEPLGLVLIISSWNFPFSLSIDPLIGAIAAGNTAVLKPSESSPATSSLLAKLVPLYLDPEAIRVIEGGTSVSEVLLDKKWDKIFFTGSSRVGRIVMSAAAKHLTPVTLELGGKSPAIVDALSDSDLEVAVKRIVSGKWGSCNGQACIAVDYVLVEEKLAPLLIEKLKIRIRKFYGNNSQELKDISRVVNKHHFKRLSNLLKDPDVSSSVVFGGSQDEQRSFIEPTILLNPPLDAEIMTEEIFGPLLPIITVSNIQESIEFINARPKPLVLYAFTKDESFKGQIVTQTSSGCVTFNDTAVQFLCDSIPFGGVGESGLGRYHGKYSFDAFSHEKGVLHRTFYLELAPRHPPWSDFKMKFIRLAYAYDYWGLIRLFLGLR
uniref:Aldehyde dehydrogenase n=1 Tax=Kalanchoe fedtschenkoi TaxID=63787 RepID=A0A7N0UGD5_KALFE